jgi:hypothetical protein
MSSASLLKTFESGISAAQAGTDAIKSGTDAIKSGNNIVNAVSSDPNLEDRVSEALLKITASDKFIESMSSSISSIIKSEILKPALTTQLNKVNDIIAQVEKLKCNNKEVKKEEAEAVANTIQETINSVNAEKSDKTNTNSEESEIIDANNIGIEVKEENQKEEEDNQEAKEKENQEANQNPVQGGKAKKSRRKNTKKSRKSRRNKR